MSKSPRIARNPYLMRHASSDEARNQSKSLGIRTKTGTKLVIRHAISRIRSESVPKRAKEIARVGAADGREACKRGAEANRRPHDHQQEPFGARKHGRPAILGQSKRTEGDSRLSHR